MDFFRGFFGIKTPKRENFDDDFVSSRECQWPEEYCKERTNLPVDTFLRDGNFFNIVQPLDPFSIFQQMEDAFSNFFSFHSNRMLEFPVLEEPFFDNERHCDFFLNPSERNLRDFFGDERDNEGDSGMPHGVELLPPHRSPRDLVLKPSYRDSQNSVESTNQQDSDLDNSLLNDEQSHNILKDFPQQPKPKMGMNWSFRKSVSIRTVQGRDGTVEEHRTEKDSSGKEVTTIRKSIGDQSYTVTLHKDSEGLKEKKEDLINLHEKDIPEFQAKWNNIKDDIHHTPKRDLFREPDSLLQDSPGDPHYTSIFKKLFRL